MTEESERLRDLVAEVAAAYFSNSHVGVTEIPDVVKQIAESLSSIGSTAAAAPAEPERIKLTPAQVRKSISPSALISFEDNKPYKTLRRHLATRGLTPEQYRDKWSLPKDYPMVSPNYSEARSNLAKNMGLGQARRNAAAAAPKAAAAKTAAPKTAKAAAPKAAAKAPKAVKAAKAPKAVKAPKAPKAAAAAPAPAKRRGRPKKTA